MKVTESPKPNGPSPCVPDHLLRVGAHVKPRIHADPRFNGVASNDSVRMVQDMAGKVAAQLVRSSQRPCPRGKGVIETASIAWLRDHRIVHEHVPLGRRGDVRHAWTQMSPGISVFKTRP